MMWDKDPVSFIDDVVLKDGAKHIKNIAKDMYSGLNDKTAVDTSRATSNWNVSLDSYDWSYDEGKKLGRGGARAKGLGEINAMPDDRLFSVYLCNPTPYIKYLNAGYSLQSPNGIVYPVFMGVSMWYR